MTTRARAPTSLGSLARVLYDIAQGFDGYKTARRVQPVSHEDLRRLLGRVEPGAPS